jgi:hypothetical protein
MPGLVPGIHVFAHGDQRQDVDGPTSPAMTSIQFKSLARCAEL